MAYDFFCHLHIILEPRCSWCLMPHAGSGHTGMQGGLEVNADPSEARVRNADGLDADPGGARIRRAGGKGQSDREGNTR